MPWSVILLTAGEFIVVLTRVQVNSKDDEIAQMATDYSPVEIAYFKAVVSSSYRNFGAILPIVFFYR